MERHLERLVDDEIERLANMQRDPDPAVRAAARKIVGPRPETRLDESREP